MNLLIVEDEIAIRTRIATTVPWEDHHIQVIGLAENGLQALEMIRKRKPDIILMDIEMSEMNGLELAREVAAHDPGVKLIVLSGYDYFEYARAAMDAGVQKYLLKPADNEEILQAVCEASEQLQREREQLHGTERLLQRWKEQLPRMRSQLFNKWLLRGCPDWEFERGLQEVALELPKDRHYCVIVLDMDPLPEGGDGRFTERDAALLGFSLYSIAEELLASDGCYVFQDEKGMTVVFAFAGKQENEVDCRLRTAIMATRVLEMVKDCLKLTASAGISRSEYGRTTVPELYRQARSAIRQRPLYGHDIACHYIEEGAVDERTDTDAADERLLETGIDTGDSNKAAEAIGRLVCAALERSSTVQAVQLELLSLSHLLIQLMRERGWPLLEIAGEDWTYLSNVQLLQSRASSESFFRRLVARMADYGDQQGGRGGNRLIRAVLTAIEQELDQDISLYGMAERYYINSSYLSRLFKHTTGQSFSAYVLERKMKRARQLLLDGALVQDAAQSVGYTNTGFFSKLFHKHWGVLPRDLKN